MNKMYFTDFSMNEKSFLYYSIEVKLKMFYLIINYKIY